jgi:energy-coupling factor transporter ATP-binding protein EcfA2
MLALDPKVLVLDEPTFGQDRENTARITARLAELNRQGMTIVIITHDMKLVAECAHRVGVMIEGRVAFDGPVAELFTDEPLLRRANLDAPPLLSVSRMLREKRPGFPPLIAVDEYKEVVCALSGTPSAVASSTA